MNSKARVKVAFTHQEPDRVPVSELYINSPVASAILGREAFTGWSGRIRCLRMNTMLIEGRADEFYEREVVDLVELYRNLELDTILIERPPLKKPLIPQKIDDTTWRFDDTDTGLWQIVHYDPKTDNFGCPDSNFHQGGLPEFERYVKLLEEDKIDLSIYSWKQAEYIIEKCPDKFVMAVADIDFPPMSMNTIGSIFLEAMAFEPELCDRYLNYKLKKAIAFTKKFASMGVDCIFDGEDLAGNNGLLFSPKDYDHFYRCRFRELAQIIHGNGMLYMRHTDGNIMKIADQFLLHSDFDGYHSIDPSAGMDLAEIKSQYGSQITLMGNVDCGNVLHLGSEEDVEHDTLRVIKTASPGGGHILSSSNTIHSSIPVRNFLKMLDTARKFGKYPINLE